MFTSSPYTCRTGPGLNEHLVVGHERLEFQENIIYGLDFLL